MFPSHLYRTALAVLAAVSSLAASAAAAPPVVDTLSPDEIIQNTVPQPEFTITGSNFVVGLPSATNRPTVTLSHVGTKTAYSTLGSVNFSGTQVTVPAGINEFNLLQAPLGTYDLTIARPDGESTTVPGAFQIIREDDQDGIYLKHIGTWGGPVNDVDVVGDLAYLANGRALRIVNIADPASVQEVGVLDLGAVAAVRVRGDYAFVAAAHPYRFCVVDVSDPATPTLVWNAANDGNVADRFPEDIHLRADYAYVRSGTRNVEAFDISDPHHVLPHGTIITGTDAERALVDGDRLYVGTTIFSTDEPAELRIYDLSADPLNPVLLGSVSSASGRETRSLAIDGAHVAWNVKGDSDGAGDALYIVDVSDPAAPTIVGQAPYFGADTEKSERLAFTGGSIYGAEGSSLTNPLIGDGMVVVDATDPANPVQIANYKPHGSAMGVRVIGDRAYLMDRGEGLIILDISNPADPVRLGQYHSPSFLRKAVKHDDLLYVADSWHGFTVLDVSDPAHPTSIGDYQAEHYDGLGVDAFGIDYDDRRRRIYLGAGHLGLEVIDVTNPSNPVLLGAYRIPVDAQCSLYWGITVTPRSNGEVIVHVGHKQGPPDCATGNVYVYFHNLEASDPSDISMLGTAVIGGGSPPRTIALGPGGYAYIGRENGHKETILNRDLTNPQLVHEDTLPVVPAVDVAVDGDTIYIANDHADHASDAGGLFIQDVATPTDPDLLASFTDDDDGPFRNSYAVAVQNDRLYATGTFNGGAKLHLFDVSDPSSPQFLFRSRPPQDTTLFSRSTTLLVEEPFVYQTQQMSGSGWCATSEGLTVFETGNLPQPILGDLDGDGAVGLADLNLVLAHFGTNNPAGDANGDGVVDLADLNIVLSNWG